MLRPHGMLGRSSGVRVLADGLKILIIDANPVRAEILKSGLREAGHDLVEWISDTHRLQGRIAALDPDVVLIDLENPNRDVLEHMFQVSRDVKRPIAMFVDRSDSAMIAASVDAGVSAYIVGGLHKERVKPILDMTISRFNAFSRLHSELAEARSALEERKVIDRAKGILMTQKSLSEADAYATLRTSAMARSVKVIDIAKSIVLASEVLK
ncbi:ANTAR domain-containing response regulator [Varunaivibrio sulfuroxidans]|uniref:ANTAR domain-containing response regulator n=1 Tax=Varunaivibrio sulfuroxidans TaxID=1773489 RepID=UPI001FB2BD97|nr:ANTAR domain-containing protein [Varunaivibrio sulfuroxidans]WES30796.1 ANTAR domain-containing protein [Varunaivibrio sulfuroxidans]